MGEADRRAVSTTPAAVAVTCAYSRLARQSQDYLVVALSPGPRCAAAVLRHQGRLRRGRRGADRAAWRAARPQVQLLLLRRLGMWAAPPAAAARDRGIAARAGWSAQGAPALQWPTWLQGEARGAGDALHEQRSPLAAGPPSCGRCRGAPGGQPGPVIRCCCRWRLLGSACDARGCAWWRGHAGPGGVGGGLGRLRW